MFMRFGVTKIRISLLEDICTNLRLFFFFWAAYWFLLILYSVENKYEFWPLMVGVGFYSLFLFLSFEMLRIENVNLIFEDVLRGVIFFFQV